MGKGTTRLAEQTEQVTHKEVEHLLMPSPRCTLTVALVDLWKHSIETIGGGIVVLIL